MYEKMYHILFAAVTDAVQELRLGNTRLAEEILCGAQAEAEDVYVRTGEEGRGKIIPIR